MGRKILVQVHERDLHVLALHIIFNHYERKNVYRKKPAIAIGQKKAYYQSRIGFKAIE